MEEEEKELELKKQFMERLLQAGYHSIQDLVELDPPKIMKIIQSNLQTAENLFVASLKAHIKGLFEKFRGNPPSGFTQELTKLGYKTIHHLADANPNILAKTLKVNLDHAGEIVVYAMELAVQAQKIENKSGEQIIKDLDDEIATQLGQMERSKKEKKLRAMVDESIQRIHKTINLPTEEVVITSEKKKGIEKMLQDFMTVFPACTGIAMYNKRGEGILTLSLDKEAKQTLLSIHENISEMFWKINLALMEKDEYGWISAQPHIVWMEAIRDQSTREQLAYLTMFIFEASAREGVGTATPTMKGLAKEIQKLIYS